MNDLAEQLESVGYPAVSGDDLRSIVEEGSKNIIFTQIVSWLSHQLQVLDDLESFINPINDPDDSSAFLLEVSSFLKELGCPHSCLTEGSVSQRLVSLNNKTLLLEYLCSELQAAKVIASQVSSGSSSMTVEVQESSTAKHLKEMLIALNFSKPPCTITPFQLFSKVQKKISELCNDYKLADVIEPLFVGTLTQKQWFQLENLWQDMQGEYSARRQMLLTRLDVTVMSFSWSERLKDAGDLIARTYTPYKMAFTNKPSVSISDVLAARKDLLTIEATSSASVREYTKSAINKVLIGEVPDRGGRPEEQQPPPPEVPSWQKNEPNKSSFAEQRRGGGFSSGDRSDRGGKSHVSSGSSFNDGNQASRGGGSFQDRVFSYSAGRPQSRGNFNRGRGDYASNSNRDQVYVGQNSENINPERGFRKMGYTSESTSGNFHQMETYPPTHVSNVHYVSLPNMYQQYGVPFYSAGGDVDSFGVGIGGYAATGGNFQQYGMTVNQPCNRGGQRGGRPGRNPRGGRRGGYSNPGYY